MVVQLERAWKLVRANKGAAAPTEDHRKAATERGSCVVDGDPADSCNRYLGSGDGYGPVLGGA